jgi:hypothetical protein
MFRCTVGADVKGHTGWGYATRAIVFPFVPTEGMKIEGLTTYPETKNDAPDDISHETVKEVYWLNRTQRFVVILGDFDWTYDLDTVDVSLADMVLRHLGPEWVLRGFDPSEAHLRQLATPRD